VENNFSKIDTIGDAYIMVAWLNEGLDQCEPKVKHAPKLKHAPKPNVCFFLMTVLISNRLLIDVRNIVMQTLD